MKEIYSKADVTFSWLGDQGEDRAGEGLWFLGKSRGWRSLFEEIDTSYRSLGHSEDPGTDKILPHDLKDSWQPYQDEVDGHILCPITMEDHENNHEGSDAPIPYQLAMENLYTPSTQCTASCKRCRLESWFEALADLFNRDYWRRRWIIQEIAASKNVVILCGKERLSWGSLTRALHKCRLSPFWNGANRRAYRFFKTILELRSSYQDTGGPCLGRVIADTQDFLSRDPRDKIFALIGISSDGPKLVPTPSYHQSPESVSIELTRAMLKQYQCFEVLL
ncbi:cell division control protein [Apiospora arundinis]